MVILGIDPGLATMGYGVIETDGFRHRLIQFGTLNTPPRVQTPQRLRSIYTGVNQLMDIYQPDEVAFEELFFAKNVTTALNVGAARGVSIAACAEYTDQLYEYTPMQVKQAIVGWGGAEKKQIQQMVKMLLHMEEIAKPDDAADAIAIALTHAAAGMARGQFRMK